MNSCDKSCLTAPILLIVLAFASGCTDASLDSGGSPRSDIGGIAKIDRAAIVAAHNKWRAEVGAGDLSYSMELEASAQAWADELMNRYRCQARHSKSGGQYGENLYWASAIMWSDGRRETQTVAPNTPVDNWASEKADYNHADNSCKPGKVCGHYTQIVWKNTQKVGCAYAVCADTRDQIWVCQYQPAGNWVGEKPY